LITESPGCYTGATLKIYKEIINMPTKHPRISLTFEAAYMTILENLAIQENKSVASLAKELVLEALERREDYALSQLSEKRETSAGKKRVAHDDAWR